MSEAKEMREEKSKLKQRINELKLDSTNTSLKWPHFSTTN